MLTGRNSEGLGRVVRKAESFLSEWAAEEQEPIWKGWSSGHKGPVTSFDGAGSSRGSWRPQVIIMDVGYL